MLKLFLFQFFNFAVQSNTLQESTATPVFSGNAIGVFQILFQCVQQSGIFGKFILLVLLIFSIISWGIMLERWRYFRKLQKSNILFIEKIWTKRRLTHDFAQMVAHEISPFAKMYRSTVRELLPANTVDSEPASPGTTGIKARISMPSMERTLENVISEEINTMEKHLSYLGTTASATPFIGLLGTVWGILTTFYQMGLSGSASFTTIAPGLAESLIATAAGLAAAIPAVIAYNHYTNRVRMETSRMYHYASELLNVIEENFTLGK